MKLEKRTPPDQHAIDSLERQQQEKGKDTAMPDPISRKRLKKKMLDRWENEGGRVAADPTSTSPTSEPKGKGKQISAKRESKDGVPASPTKKRKATGK